jgi:hypothetical protein
VDKGIELGRRKRSRAKRSIVGGVSQGSPPPRPEYKLTSQHGVTPVNSHPTLSPLPTFLSHLKALPKPPVYLPSQKGQLQPGQANIWIHRIEGQG